MIAVEKFGKVQNLGHRMGLQCNFLGKGFELSHLLLKLNIVENDVGVFRPCFFGPIIEAHPKIKTSISSKTKNMLFI